MFIVFQRATHNRDGVGKASKIDEAHIKSEEKRGEYQPTDNQRHLRARNWHGVKNKRRNGIGKRLRQSIDGLINGIGRRGGNQQKSN